MVDVTAFRSWNLHANDLDAMMRFYCDVLGAERRTTQTLRGTTVERIQLAGVGLGLFDSSKGEFPGVPHHAFATAGPGDAESLVKELESKGAKVDGTRQHGDGPGYSVYVIDPSGNRLELSWDRA